MPRFTLLWLLLACITPVSGGTLRVVADPSCPYVCPDLAHPERAAKAPGIIYELLEQILSAEGYDLEFKFVPYSRGLEGVRAGEYDLLMVTLREDEPSLYYHQIPIAMARGCFVVSNASQWNYSGIDSLLEVRFGGTLGYKYGPLGEFIDKDLPNTLMMSGEDTFDRILRMIEMGRLDATIEDINVIQYKLKELGKQRSLRLAGCLPPNVPLYTGISVNFERKQEVANLIDRGIQRMVESGHYQETLRRYGVDSPK